jgi:hypothetical protein
LDKEAAMAWQAVFLLLASGQDFDVPPIAPPRLVCRYETPISRLVSRRKLCLTEEQWLERDRVESEASRRSIYELMGNTACANGGICTSFRSISSDPASTKRHQGD